MSDQSQDTLVKRKVSDIQLDPLNPRLGKNVDEKSTQSHLARSIVNSYGVSDLLSSMAVNGYFEAEPIVCVKRDGLLYVVEGNRRLVSCMILSNDPRVAELLPQFSNYLDIHKDHGSPKVSEIPIIEFSGATASKKINAYLGIRHIVSTKDWDSYAKAHWIANMVETGGLSLIRANLSY